MADARRAALHRVTVFSEQREHARDSMGRLGGQYETYGWGRLWPYTRDRPGFARHVTRRACEIKSDLKTVVSYATLCSWTSQPCSSHFLFQAKCFDMRENGARFI